MKKIVKIVNEVLNQADFMGLMYEDVNEFEYLLEAQKISEFIDIEKPNTSELANLIQKIFIMYFETIVDFEECEVVADCILMNLEEM